jgi:hypothetical protein
MNKVVSHIKIIGDQVHEFKALESLQISENIDQYTDTATIVLLRKAKWSSEKIRQHIKRGNAISISIGYDDQLLEVFTGYISKISASNDVKIECENEMYKLKQTQVSVSYANATLTQLLKDILPADIQYVSDEANLGQFRTNNNPNVVKVFEELKKYALSAYFKNNILYVGIKTRPEHQKHHKLKFGYHPISDSLQYFEATDIQYKIKAISILKNNTKIEVETGDPEGETRTLHYYNITSKEELKRIAEAEIEKYKYDGLRGSFTTGGLPHIQKGDIIEFLDPVLGERTGKYLVNSVVRTLTVNGGIKQNVSIKYKIK